MQETKTVKDAPQTKMLPDDWEEDKLGAVCDVQGGYAFKSKKYSESGRVVVKIGSLQNGTVIENKRTSYWPESEMDETIKKYELEEGDVLIAMTGATTGKLAIVPKEYEGSLLNQRVGRFLPQDEERFNKLFGRYFFQTNYFQREIGGNILKSAQGNISPTKIKNIEIPLPPLPEQRKIASILTAVRNAIEQTEAVIQATRELKKSMMKHLFTYGPVPVDQTDQVELEETDLGYSPAEWEKVELDQLIKLRNGKTKPNDISEFRTEEYPFSVYGGNGIIGFAQKKLINHETIVIGRVGEYCGSIYDIKKPSWITDNAMFVKEFQKENIKPSYLALALKVLDLNRFHNRSGQPLINQSIVYSKTIPIPHPEVQEKIISTVQSLNNRLYAEIDKKKSLESLFNSLLENLMTAKVRVV